MAAVTDIYPIETWATESLLVLTSKALMAGLIYRNFENVPGTQGKKVHTRKPRKLTKRSWSGVGGTATVQRTDEMTVENLLADELVIELSYLDYTSFIVEDRDAALSIVDLINEYIVPAVDPLVQGVDSNIMTCFTGKSGTEDQDVHSTAVAKVAQGSTGLGATIDADDLISAYEALETAQCPSDNRKLVLGTRHYADLLRAAIFQQAQQAGTTEALRNANLGRAFGFDCYSTQNVPNATDSNTTPQSIAFHPNACALVTRPLPPVPAGMGATSAVRSMNGVGIRVVSSYEHEFMGVVMSFSVLYGVKLMDAHLAKIINP